MDKRHIKKMIAPIVIVALILLYSLGIVAVIAIDEASIIAKITGFAIYSGVFGVAIFVLKERINEIRSGEEDDISKY